HIAEWHSPDFQQDPIQLFLIVGLLMAVTGLGVRLRGPRLIAYGMLLILGLSYTRGLIMFYVLTPVILARPVSECDSWFRAVRSSQAGGSFKTTSSSDPVLLYLQKQSMMIPTVFLAVATLVTAMSWRQIGLGPPGAVAPKAAIDFVEKAGITGNVFNN